MTGEEADSTLTSFANCVEHIVDAYHSAILKFHFIILANKAAISYPHKVLDEASLDAVAKVRMNIKHLLTNRQVIAKKSTDATNWLFGRMPPQSKVECSDSFWHEFLFIVHTFVTYHKCFFL